MPSADLARNSDGTAPVPPVGLRDVFGRTVAMPSSRALALDALGRWRNGMEFADRIVAETFARTSLGPSDRAFTLELFYGLLRNLTLLDFWIAQLRSEPVDPGTRDLLRLGLYQIMFLETAPHAAVYETVALARPRVRPVVNAILRRALREKNALTSAADSQPVHVRFSHPEFLVERWSRQFGAEAGLELCRWNNQPAPVYARINRLKTTVAEFLQRYPGSSLLPGHENFVALPDAALARGEGRWLHPGPEHGACLRNVAARAGRKRPRCLCCARGQIRLSRRDDGEQGSPRGGRPG